MQFYVETEEYRPLLNTLLPTFKIWPHDTSNTPIILTVIDDEFLHFTQIGSPVLRCTAKKVISPPIFPNVVTLYIIFTQSAKNTPPKNSQVHSAVVPNSRIRLPTDHFVYM